MANGFGGLGSSYPMRTNAPESQNVMADGEWNANWQNQLSAIPQYITTGASDPVWTNVSALDNSSAVNVLNQAANKGSPYEWQSTGAVDPIGQNMPDLYIQTKAGSAGTTSLNPEWDKLNKQYQDELAARNNNQSALQQAYNVMQGNYAFNGNLTSDYTNPNYGQVSGTQTATTIPSGLQTGLSGSTVGGTVGSDQQQIGVYNPASSTKNWSF